MKTLTVLGILIAFAGTAVGQGRGQAVPPANLPDHPTPVALPKVSADSESVQVPDESVSRAGVHVRRAAPSV
jgi:hypothetical protein